MTMTTDAAIGERVHQLMWRQRITVTALAQQLGIAQTTLSRKLRGERPWFAAEIASAATHLGVEVADLFGQGKRRDDEARPAIDGQDGLSVRPKGLEPPTFCLIVQRVRALIRAFARLVTTLRRLVVRVPSGAQPTRIATDYGLAA